MTGMRKRIFGTTLVVNLNAKKGFRKSPGAGSRALAIRRCAKKQGLEARKNCFKGQGLSGIVLKDTPKAIEARAEYRRKKEAGLIKKR